MPLLVLGTHNRKKLGELADLLVPFGFELRNLDDYPNSVEVEETGSTFTENAALKATPQAQRIGAWVLGEDSGLVVDALGGEPGVMSARFSGPGATDGPKVFQKKIAAITANASASAAIKRSSAAFFPERRKKLMPALSRSSRCLRLSRSTSMSRIV